MDLPITQLLGYGSDVILKQGNRVINFKKNYFSQGYINKDYSFVINHVDIKEILFIGFIDEEEKQFVEFLSN
ncbi:DUF4176 domain-containing protein [Bacillus marasmi]|uniref:DUF4176 domain-containing protein n=1 Tax=Bacillus marasmi TaxID=1926279 RepID=UPI0011CA2F35|nr:DUF4176 domain-containing protein [Bacillus marasmi]